VDVLLFIIILSSWLFTYILSDSPLFLATDTLSLSNTHTRARTEPTHRTVLRKKWKVANEMQEEMSINNEGDCQTDHFQD